MFSIAAEANGRSLQVPGDVTVDVPAELVGDEADENGVSPVKLWSMNEKTGRWVVESDLVSAGGGNSSRTKRQSRGFQTTIKGIPITQTWYNFDAISTRTCYSKVRVFLANSSEQVEYARVGVIVTDGFARNSVSYVRASTDVNELDGYCVAHPCDNELRSLGSGADGSRGLIFADLFGDEATPLPTDNVTWLEPELVDELEYEVVNNSIEVNLNLRENDTIGPFYDWDYPKWRYSDRCSNATPLENYFHFTVPTKKDCTVTNPDPIETRAFSGKPKKCKANRIRQLYSYPDIKDKWVTSCYLSVRFHPSTGYTDAIAYSYSGTAAIEGKLQPGDLYGTSQDCLKKDQYNQIYACLEIRAPSRVSCSVNPDDIVDDDYTLVTVTAFDANDDQYDYSSPRLRWQLEREQFRSMRQHIPARTKLLFEHRQHSYTTRQNSLTFRVYPAMTYYQCDHNSGCVNAGLYCETAATLASARTTARARCNRFHQ